MKRESFKKHMNNILELKEAGDALNKAISKLDPDFNYFSLGKAFHSIVEVLQEAMDDKNEWIAYWLYECDYGKDTKDRVHDKKGKVIPIETLDNLYDLIASDRKKKRAKL